MPLSTQLEVFRLEAIRQLENEQQDRAAKIRELHQAIADFEATETSLVQAILRANKPLKGSKCPRCWIWDGELIDMKPIPGDAQFDKFRCGKCGQELEAPA